MFARVGKPYHVAQNTMIVLYEIEHTAGSIDLKSQLSECNGDKDEWDTRIPQDLDPSGWQMIVPPSGIVVVIVVCVVDDVIQQEYNEHDQKLSSDNECFGSSMIGMVVIVIITHELERTVDLGVGVLVEMGGHRKEAEQCPLSTFENGQCEEQEDAERQEENVVPNI